MLDCGFAVRETERRLARLQLLPSDLSGIIVTHEHQDHIGGVFKFARRHRIPVWLSYGTWLATRDRCDAVDVRFCRDGEVFAIGDLEVSPYTVPHDAAEPVQYVIGNGMHRLGVLTDAGHGTAHMIAALDGCDALMLECNHDRQMLLDSAYPPSLKIRIGGDYGHLSNDAAAHILHALDRSRLSRIVAAHLSTKNNTPELARAALESVIAGTMDIRIACQEHGLEWIGVAD